MNYELLRSADGRDLQFLGSVDLTVGLLVPYQFFVIDGRSHNALLGIDFFAGNRLQIGFEDVYC